MGNSEFALEVHSNHGQQKARKMYSKDENLYVIFVDRKRYVEGMLTHYQRFTCLLGSYEKQMWDYT